MISFPAADLSGADMTQPQEYITAKQKDGGGTVAVEVLKNIALAA